MPINKEIRDEITVLKKLREIKGTSDTEKQIHIEKSTEENHKVLLDYGMGESWATFLQEVSIEKKNLI